ncbi:MAG: cytochrome b [Kordiimonadaceae bacterium]|jgi:cytochrome b561|nr:cytochrome b [Kordiimonadaceae bacterium]MBT6035113.1 cytochrome b [Kordiimonadaceae bacterium]MBT6329645.1 cytochrome b [Kordiimonadaceae bacterium]
MSAKNTNNSYGWVAKTFHWGIFMIIIGQFWLGGNFKEEQFEGMGLNKVHFLVGITILFLMLVRLAWRAKNPVPEMPEGTGKLQALGAHGLHILFYILLIALPVAGITANNAADEGTVELAKTMHGIFAKSTLAAVLIHIIMAMYHNFVKKDNVLKRMLPW